MTAPGPVDVESSGRRRDRWDEEWRALVAALDAWTSAGVVGPGRIEVALPGSGRRVVVVVTPEEWSEDVAGIGFGSEQQALRHVKEVLVGLQPEESFAVYGQYRLEASTGSTLPEPDDDLLTGPGEWVALDRDGEVVSRFAEGRDPSEDA